LRARLAECPERRCTAWTGVEVELGISIARGFSLSRCCCGVAVKESLVTEQLIDMSSDASMVD
jgi:hypothetical protein